MTNPYEQPPKNSKLTLLVWVCVFLLMGTVLLLLYFPDSSKPTKQVITFSPDTQEDHGGYHQGLIAPTEQELAQVKDAHLPYYGSSEFSQSRDLSAHMPPPGSQGTQGSCVGWATAYAVKSYQEKQEMGFASFISNTGQLNFERVFSPSFVYNQINDGRDRGAKIIDALTLIRAKGAALWSDMPYKVYDFVEKPTPELLGKTSIYKIESWRKLPLSNTVVELKSMLDKGFPVVIGMLVDPSFKAINDASVWTGALAFNHSRHALVVVGYDDAKQAFKLFNSWGKDWGDKGYGWVDYQKSQKVIKEAYIMKDAVNQQVSPDSPPTQINAKEITFHITKITHRIPTDVITNAPYPLDSFDKVMKISGYLEVPEEYTAHTMRVVVKFYHTNAKNEKLTPIKDISYKFKRFSLPDGQIVASSPEETFASQKRFKHWAVYIPYDVLNQDSSEFDVLVEPVLYLDQFGVSSGNDYAFTIVRE